MSDRVALTVRLTPEAHRLLEAHAPVGKGQAARMVLELCCERLRANGGDMLEMMMTLRDALKNGTGPQATRPSKDSDEKGTTHD